MGGISFCSSAFYVAQRRKELSLSFGVPSWNFFNGVLSGPLRNCTAAARAIGATGWASMSASFLAASRVRAVDVQRG